MTEDQPHLIDALPDDLGLARAQIDAGVPALAEGTVRRRLARLEADAAGGEDESDALRLLLAEALWRQQRPGAARVALEAIRPGSPQRRLPTSLRTTAMASGPSSATAATGPEVMNLTRPG